MVLKIHFGKERSFSTVRGFALPPSDLMNMIPVGLMAKMKESSLLLVQSGFENHPYENDKGAGGVIRRR